MGRKLEYSDENAEKVKEWILCGASLRTICTALDISEPTLRKNYGQIIAQAKLEAAEKVGRRIYDEASRPDGDPKLAIHYSKTQLEWQETNRLDVEISDEDGKLGVLAELALKLGKGPKSESDQ